VPTYEYRCPKGHVFEKFYSTMNNRRRLRCPTCGSMAERLVSGGAGFVFKGPGFYITDYKRAGEKPAESEAKETKPESKPEKAADKPATEKPKSSKPKSE
jgi:putative FmdB family regulatory protein